MSGTRLPRLGWDGTLPQARQASCCYSRSGLVRAVLCKCDPHSGQPAPQLSALYCIPPLWLPSLPTRCSPLGRRSGLRKELLSAGGSEGLASVATSMSRAKDTLQQWMVGGCTVWVHPQSGRWPDFLRFLPPFITLQCWINLLSPLTPPYPAEMEKGLPLPPT